MTSLDYLIVGFTQLFDRNCYLCIKTKKEKKKTAEEYFLAGRSFHGGL